MTNKSALYFTTLFSITVVLLSASFECLSQDNSSRLTIHKGQVEYKRPTGWFCCIQGMELTDSTWLRIKSATGDYTVKRNGLCAEITEADIKMVKTLNYAQCNKNADFFDNIRRGIKSDSSTEAADRDYKKSHALLFPAKHEILLLDSSIFFRWGDKLSDRALIIEMPRERFFGVMGATHSDSYVTYPIQSTDTIFKLTTSKKRFSVPESYKWGLENTRSELIPFRIASQGDILKLKAKLDLLALQKDSYDSINYYLAKAAIYEEMDMHSEAAKIYEALEKQNPQSEAVHISYNYFIDKVIQRNMGY